MLSLAFYFLKVIICSAVFFGYYWFFLRNKIFHSYNRFFLLAIIVIALLAPVIKINIWHNASAGQTNVIKVLQVVNSSNDYMDEVILYSKYNHITKERIFNFFYPAVSSFFLMMFLNALLKIRSLLKRNSATVIENIYFVKTHAKGTPFSFLKFIFWNEAIDLETKAGQQIFKHELAHVQEKHSHDKLFINVILIFCWCNPFFWLIRKEINMIHEFIADKKAVENGNSGDFAVMILQATYPQYRFPLANNFFYSPIKRRLMMLTKQNKTRFNYLSRLIVLPVAIIVFAAFTIKAKTYHGINSNAENKIINVVIDAGHGGKDLGGQADNMIYEKDLNLAFAKKIKALNSNDNIKLIFTRESDIYMSPQEKSSFARKAGADLFISIHMASTTENEASTKTGMEVFVSKDQFKNSERSKILASAVIGSFQGNYDLKLPSNPMQRQVGIWVLQDSQCPAVLIEAGYISNKNDLAYLRTEKAAEAFAKNILAALEKYRLQNSAIKLQSPGETIKIEVDSIPVKRILENKAALQSLQEKMTSLQLKELKTQLARLKEDSTYDKASTLAYREKLNALNANQKINASQLINLKQAELAMQENININIQKTELLNQVTLQQLKEINSKNIIERDIVFSKVEQEPEFPGGKLAWAEFLMKNLDAAMPVKEGWKEGTYQIIVKFIVKEDGSVADVTTENYVNTKTAKACIDLIKNGPSWIPAKQNGKTVRAYRKQPITFVVSEQ